MATIQSAQDAICYARLCVTMERYHIEANMFYSFTDQALTLSSLDHWPSRFEKLLARGPVDLRSYWSTNSRNRQHSHSL